MLVRSLRTAMLEMITSDFATAAQSRGLSYRRVLIRHVLRNCLIPLVPARLRWAASRWPASQHGTALGCCSWCSRTPMGR